MRRTMRSRLSMYLDRLQLPNGAPFDALVVVRALEDVRDEDAGRDDRIRIQLTWLDDLFHLREGDLAGGGHHRVEVPRGLPVDEVPFRVGLVALDEREVGMQRRLEEVVAPVDDTRLLPLADHRPVAGRGEEAADARAGRANPLRERALRHERVLDFAGNRLPLELLVLADVAADEVRDLLRPPQNADAEVVHARVVADDCQVARSARVKRPDQIFRKAAQAEA